jgi:hypothetical protein
MSYSISTLLTRNLHDVFGENDPARRRATASRRRGYLFLIGQSVAPIGRSVAAPQAGTV